MKLEQLIGNEDKKIYINECIKDRNKKNIPILKYNIDGNPDDLQENEIVIWGDVYTKSA